MHGMRRPTQLVKIDCPTTMRLSLTAMRSRPRLAEEAGIDQPVRAPNQATHRLNLLDP
jgi:hypothetical protein